MAADVEIKIQVESKKAQKSLNNLDKSLKQTGKDAEKTVKIFGKSFSVMAVGATAVAAAVTAIGAAIVSSIDQASKLQDLETQFIAFTGSAEAAAAQVEKIAEFSGQTPFQLEDLVKANRTLLAFGQSSEQSLKTLGQLGDVAAGTGADLGELSLILGQVEAAGKLTGERFLQFAERGINLAPILAKQLGVAETQIAQLRKEGKISSEDVAKAFESMTSAGGKFEGSMKRLSLTFSGASSTLSDNIGLLSADLGKIFLPVATDMTVAFTELVKKIREYTKETKTDKIEAFNNQIAASERVISNLNQQLGAAKEGGFLFRLFGGDPQAETISLNKELKANEAQLIKLKSLRDKAKDGPEDTDAKEKKDKVSDETLKQVSEAEKLSAEIAVINDQKLANDKARGAAANAIVVEQLDLQREIILQKEAEKQIALLESQGLFQEAQALQAEENLRRIEATEQAALDKRLAAGKKARADEINLVKIDAKAKVKWDEQSYQQRAQTAQKGIAALISLQSTGSREAFEIGKAASIAQALVAIPTTAIEAYKSLAGIPVVGPGLGAAAAAAAVVAGTARVNQIRSTQFTGMAEGGLVEGGIRGVDSVPLLAQAGEVVVPRKNFEQIGFNNDQQVMLLNQIKQLLETPPSQVEPETGFETVSEPLVVNLMLNEEVLANQILEINRDNQRVS